MEASVTTLGPTPSRLHVALSVVVIGECLFLFSAGIACLTMTWDPCAMFSGVLLAPLNGFLGFVQYAGTFRCHAASARRASLCGFIFGGFVAFASVAATIEFLAEGELPPGEFIIPLLAFAVPHLWNGFLNRRWHQELISSGYATVDRRFRLSMRELLVTIGAIGVFLGLTLYFVREEGPQCAVGVSADESPIDLPFDATNVSYCKGMRGGIAIEFTTTEEAFRNWAMEVQSRLDEGGVNVAEIKNARYIQTYASRSPDLQGPDFVEVTNGLAFDWQIGDDTFGQGCFDRTTGRAYYNR